MSVIELQIPNTMVFTPEQIRQMVSLNPEIHLEFINTFISISEREFPFSERDFFRLIFPFKVQLEDLYKIDELNQHLKLEGDEEGVIINMGTWGLIGAFTAAILITVGLWNRRMKLGRVFDSSTNHDLETNGKKKFRVPDVSFIAYQKFTSKVLDSEYRLGSPTLCIEVVSRKESLSDDLKKMESEWMNGGTEIGLVVCPHRQKYYIFRTNRSGYETISFQVPFTHEKLPELVLDFAALLREAMEEG